MTESDTKIAILNAWQPAWEALHPANVSHPAGMLIAYSGEKFKPSDVAGTELGAWGRVTVQFTSRRQATAGRAPNRKFESRGNVYVELYAEVNHITPGGAVLDGDKVIDQLAEDARSCLEGKRVGSINLYEARRSDHTMQAIYGVYADDSPWRGTTIIVPFRMTEQK